MAGDIPVLLMLCVGYCVYPMVTVLASMTPVRFTRRLGQAPVAMTVFTAYPLL